VDFNLKLFLDEWQISGGKLFKIFTLFLEKDLICLSGLESLTKLSPLKDDLSVLCEWMLTLEMNKVAILGGNKLLEMSSIRTITERKNLGYSVRFVVTVPKVHQAEGMFLENKNYFLAMNLGSSASCKYMPYNR